MLYSDVVNGGAKCVLTAILKNQKACQGKDEMSEFLQYGRPISLTPCEAVFNRPSSLIPLSSPTRRARGASWPSRESPCLIKETSTLFLILVLNLECQYRPGQL
jgi:hypothetical protein